MKKKVFYSWIIVLLCFSSYFGILFNGFVWDDETFIVNRVDTKSFSGVVESFSNDVYGIYRPVRTLMYFMSFKIFGLNPFWYHLVSIILHSIATVLIFYILDKLFGTKIGFLSSLIFAVHPIHVERVTGATGAYDLFGIILYLSSFLLYIIYREKGNKKYFQFSILFFIIGLFSSEEVYTLPLMILLYEIIFGKWKQYKNYLSYYVIFGVFAFFRIVILNIGSRVGEYPGGNAWVTFLTMPKIIIEYIVLVLFPIGLSPFRKVMFIENINMIFIVSIMVILFFIYYVYINRQNKKLLFFSFWFLITMLPFLNITPLQKIIGERYMYLASLSMIVLIVSVYNQIHAKFKNVGFILVVLIIFFSGLTIYNNSFWKDDTSFYFRGFSINPEDPKINNNLGTYYFEREDYQNAQIHFLRSVTIDDQYHRAWVNLGVLYSRVDDYNKSIKAFHNALIITPNNWVAHDKLGVTYMRMGDNSTAEAHFLKAISLNDKYYPAYSRLATLYGNMGNYSLAFSYLQEAIKINPYYAEAYFNLGVLFDIHGQREEAMEFYGKAYSLDPDNELYASRVR